MHCVSTYSLGQTTNGNKRVWLATRNIQKSQLSKGQRINIHFDSDNKRIEIIADEHGSNVISGRKDSDLPIIDIKSKQVLATLGQGKKITVKFFNQRIVVEVPKNERLKAIREAKKGNVLFDLFAGGGSKSHMAKRAGFNVKYALELEDKFLDCWSINHAEDNTITYHMDINDIDEDDLPKDVDVIAMGYPCTSYSQSNSTLHAKRHAGDPEAIKTRMNADMMSLAVLKIIQACQPKAVMIEETREFIDSLPYNILRHSLEAMGFAHSETKVTGSYTKRERVAICFIASDTPVDLNHLEYHSPKPLNDVLPVPWDHVSRVYKHIDDCPRERGAKRRGIGVRAHNPLVDTKCNTLTTHWSRGTHPSWKDPYRAEYYTDITIEDAKALHGISPNFYLPKEVTVARQIIGQGVTDIFVKVFVRIHQAIKLTNDISTASNEHSLDSKGQLCMGF